MTRALTFAVFAYVIGCFGYFFTHPATATEFLVLALLLGRLPYYIRIRRLYPDVYIKKS